MASIDEYSVSDKVEVDVVIAASASTSTVGNLYGTRLRAVSFPSAFTGASVTYEGGVGSGYQAIHNGSGAISTTATASKAVVVDPDQFRGFDAIKVVAASAQAAQRTITLICAPQ